MKDTIDRIDTIVYPSFTRLDNSRRQVGNPVYPVYPVEIIRKITSNLYVRGISNLIISKILRTVKNLLYDVFFRNVVKITSFFFIKHAYTHKSKLQENPIFSVILNFVREFQDLETKPPRSPITSSKKNNNYPQNVIFTSWLVIFTKNGGICYGF